MNNIALRYVAKNTHNRYGTNNNAAIFDTRANRIILIRIKIARTIISMRARPIFWNPK